MKAKVAMKVLAAVLMACSALPAFAAATPAASAGQPSVKSATAQAPVSKKTASAPASKARKPAATPPVITAAWISESPPVAKNNAAFVTLTNGSRRDALLSVSTPAADAAELHQMSMAGGLMRMQRLPLINLAPNQTLTLSPGGRHIMLINMKQPLKAGDKVPLTLKFRQAGSITVQADVRALVVEDGNPHDSH